MAKYIECEAFIADQRNLYCDNCERRKGMKNGKMKFVYAIGEAPCRACGIGDMLDSIDDYPAAVVVPVRHGKWEYIGGYGYQFRCSECILCAEYKTNYCPNCGALMDKDGDGDA